VPDPVEARGEAPRASDAEGPAEAMVTGGDEKARAMDPAPGGATAQAQDHPAGKEGRESQAQYRGTGRATC